MKIEIFTLTEAATFSSGKLNILGSFDVIVAKSIPSIHPLCALAIKIRFNKDEQGVHKIKALLNDPDGKEIKNIVEDEVTFEANYELASHQMIAWLTNLKFEKSGLYKITLICDEIELDNIPLYLIVNEQKKI